jgi:maleylacetoacetate isomerase
MAIKQLPCEWVSINLLSDEPESPAHLERNPMGYVPVLEILSGESDSQYLTESVAIIEWLEELYPSPSLFPSKSIDKARVRQLAEIINSGIQPLQNLNVAQAYSEDPLKQKEWMQIWIRKGFQAYEKWAKETSGEFSWGDQMSYADLFLIPQCYNAQRQGIDLAEFPLLKKIYLNSLATHACRQSAPEQFQPKN